MSAPFRSPVPESNPRDRALFRVNPMSYIVIAIFVLAILWPVTAYPLALGWLVLLPLAFGWWVARTWTRLDEDGVQLSSWRTRRSVQWDEVKGVMFPKRGFARLVTTSDASLPMGGVSFHDLPRLSSASRGRIRDPYTAPGPNSTS
ncbi:PH domain-containing protein [Dietzia sp. ANT_WB102]|uniref:PH domain-containing protein n=1 Tax=Dietzia sp. ANT_WB102 TaxID=2597345 RepID=UPI0011ED3F0D|nr:PH domain-containing protein [Dietzia sp. ANT_WB102]KAA0919485.1 PH domain-containing protein [Dietzia sp. ANT_WB102]